ncbi:MAG: enoyl-CoA hydratase/isomerase family protein [Actinomycetota bacterium]
MSERQQVRYEVGDRRATITIDREDKRNALNAAVLDGILQGLRQAAADASVSAIVLTGAGEKAFCAGADLGGIQTDASKVQQHLARGAIVEVLETMRRCGKPVVARVNGHALAGGFGLVCGADLVVATEEASFGLPEVRSGLWPFVVSAVVRQRLPDRVALELMMTGRRMDAAEAERWGVVNRIAKTGELDVVTDGLVDELVSKSPMTLRLGKDSFYESQAMETRAAMSYLHSMLGICLETEDVLEGITAFLQKREPVWKGR